MGQAEDVQAQVLKTLNTHYARSIKYSYPVGQGFRTMDWTGLDQVADKIVAGELEVRVKKVTGGFDAIFKPGHIDVAGASMEVPDQALLVHECTHAYLYYFTNLKDLQVGGNEACGYISQGMFLYEAGFTGQDPDKLVAKGVEIATSVRKADTADRLVDTALWNDIVGLVNSSPRYRHEKGR